MGLESTVAVKAKTGSREAKILIGGGFVVGLLLAAVACGRIEGVPGEARMNVASESKKKETSQDRSRSQKDRSRSQNVRDRSKNRASSSNRQGKNLPPSPKLDSTNRKVKNRPLPLKLDTGSKAVFQGKSLQPLKLDSTNNFQAGHRYSGFKIQHADRVSEFAKDPFNFKARGRSAEKEAEYNVILDRGEAGAHAGSLYLASEKGRDHYAKKENIRSTAILSAMSPSSKVREEFDSSTKRNGKARGDEALDKFLDKLEKSVGHYPKGWEWIYDEERGDKFFGNQKIVAAMRLPMDDSEGISAFDGYRALLDGALKDGVVFIHKYLQANTDVIVNCQAGKSRSATIVFVYTFLLHRFNEVAGKFLYEKDALARKVARVKARGGSNNKDMINEWVDFLMVRREAVDIKGHFFHLITKAIKQNMEEVDKQIKIAAAGLLEKETVVKNPVVKNLVLEEQVLEDMVDAFIKDIK